MPVKQQQELVESGAISREQLNESLQSDGDRNGGTSGQKSIPMVDDSRNIRNLVKFVLQADGCGLLEAGNGKHGREMVRRRSDSLNPVTLHYEMPSMTGVELVPRMRGPSKFDSIALVTLTPREDENDEVTSLDSGADNYICKPAEPMKLQACTRKMIDMYDHVSSFAIR